MTLETFLAIAGLAMALVNLALIGRLANRQMTQHRALTSELQRLGRRTASRHLGESLRARRAAAPNPDATAGFRDPCR